MPDIHDEMDDRVLSHNDHDLLIRLHERMVALHQQIQNFMTVSGEMNKRIVSLESWRANQTGAQTVMVRTASTIAAIISSVISALIVYLLTR